MTVPETTVCLNDGLILGQDDVGSAGQTFPVNPEPVASTMKALTQEQLQLRVFSFDAGHHPASSFSGNDVSHAPPRRRMTQAASGSAVSVETEDRARAISPATA